MKLTLHSVVLITIFSHPNHSHMKRYLIIFLLVLPCMISAGGWKSMLWTAGVFNNATLLPPASLTAVFNQPLHPGVMVSGEFGWKAKGSHKWYQDAGLGYMYHRYAFQSFLLISKAGYRRYMGRFTPEVNLQAGYMHSLMLTDRALLQDDGTYAAKQGFGKPQFIAGAGIGLGYDLGTAEKMRRLVLAYDIRLQMPFVKSYVPLLPNGALSVGMQFNLR